MRSTNALRVIALIAAGIFGAVVLFWFVLGSTVVAAYSYYFNTLVFRGGVDAWLARAVGLLFATAMFVGVRTGLSLNRQRRTIGGSIVVGSVALFSVLVYLLAPNSREYAKDGDFFDADGRAKVSYSISTDGEWELFPISLQFHPTTGVELTPITPPKAKAYLAYKDAQEQRTLLDNQRRDAERRREEERRRIEMQDERERRYRDRYCTDLRSHALAKHPSAILIAVEGQPPTYLVDIVRGHLVELAEDRGRKPISTAFKPDFINDGLFEAVWRGDVEILRRLGAFDVGPGVVLLAKIESSAAAATDFDGFVSVRGRLSVMSISENAARGPWVYEVAGAGTDAPTATANCARRLVGLVEKEVVLP